jgi:GT2 family glycosyltransferase
MDKVVVAVRSGVERNGWTHPHLTAWLLSLAYERKYFIHFDLIYGVPGLAASANAAAKGFTERQEFIDAEWFCLVDNDTVPQPNMMRILDEIPDYVDIVSPLCPMTFNDNIFPQQGFYKDAQGNRGFLERSNIFEPLEDLTPGLHEVDRVGGGCWFVRRRVFQAMTPPYFRDIFDPNTEEIIVTDDCYFQDQARRKGFRVFVDTRFTASHYHTVDLLKLMFQTAQSVV